MNQKIMEGNCNPEINILSVEPSPDTEYGRSIIKYSVGNNFVSYIFSDRDSNETVETLLNEIKDSIEKNSGIESYPLWSEMSGTLLGLIRDSEFDMKFVEYDDDDWDKEKADNIMEEAKRWHTLDNVIEYGEDSYLAIYASAVCCVNWLGNEYYD